MGKYRKLTGGVALAAAVLFIVLVLMSHHSPPNRGTGVMELNTGWQCSYGDTSLETGLPASLDVPAGTVVTISRVLPETGGGRNGICFRTRLQRVEMYLDGELIHKFPKQKLIGDIVPGIWNFVMLPEDCGGKLLEIRLESPYDGFSGYLPEISYGQWNTLGNQTTSRYMPALLLSIMVGVVGIVLILLPLFFRKYYRNPERQTSQGILLVFVSLWLMTESRMPLNLLGVEGQYYIPFLSLALCPFFVFSFLYACWPDICGRITKFLLWVSLACAGLWIGLDAFGAADYPEMLLPIHALAIVCLVYMVYIYSRAVSEEKAGRSEMACILLLLFSAALELIFFYSRTNWQVGRLMRLSMVVFALNFLRLSVLTILKRLKEYHEIKEQLRLSRLELMNSQIRPHFIYNTLNSIRALIRINPDAASEAVYDFSTYLRGNLQSLEEKDTIPFSEELKHIRAYLNIEKLRMGSRLRTEFEIQEEDFPVPSLSVQPLVENAVKHGIWKKKEAGTVRITERETDEAHVICVEDDGPGFDPEKLEEMSESGHMGIRNIRFRIEKQAGGTIQIESGAGKGVRITVKLPSKQQRRREKR